MAEEMQGGDSIGTFVVDHGNHFPELYDREFDSSAKSTKIMPSSKPLTSKMLVIFG